MKKILIAILAILGVLFILIMIMPDDQDVSSDYSISVDHDTNTDYETKTPSPGAAFADAEPVSVGTDAKSATIMVYMNGSDLESEAGEATTDLSEMIASGIGHNVNVVVQTMGTKEWQDYDISSKTAQTWVISDKELKLVRDDLGQLDCTSADTLSEFINYCKSNYAADRYMFLFWDHGGGPVYGFGYDEWQPEGASLTVAEMSKAFMENKDIHFDIIGMDCCIMANLETCYALAPYCKYALLSEDFESGIGWSYTNWMKRFEENPGMSTPVLGKYIVDDIISENETSSYGDSSCMALFNESTIVSLFDAWKKYAYQNEEALLKTNYSRNHEAKGRGEKGFWELWGFDDSNVTLSDYYISDMLAIIENVDKESEAAKNLLSSLKACVAYYGHTSDKNELTGIAVSLPYGDASFYDELKSVYTDLGMDSEYIGWLEGFVSTSDYDDYYDYGYFESEWSGWGAYEDEYGCNGSSCLNSWFYDDDGSYSDDFCRSDNYGFFDYSDDSSYDDWIYDYEEKLWYLYEDDVLYLYDDETDTMYCYYESDDTLYYYDDNDGQWYITE